MQASIGRSHQQSVVGPVYYMHYHPCKICPLVGVIVVWFYVETNYFMAGFEAHSIRGTSHLVWKPGQMPVASRAGEVIN